MCYLLQKNIFFLIRNKLRTHFSILNISKLSAKPNYKPYIHTSNEQGSHHNQRIAVLWYYSYDIFTFVYCLIMRPHSRSIYCVGISIVYLWMYVDFELSPVSGHIIILLHFKAQICVTNVESIYVRTHNPIHICGLGSEYRRG